LGTEVVGRSLLLVVLLRCGIGVLAVGAVAAIVSVYRSSGLLRRSVRVLTVGATTAIMGISWSCSLLGGRRILAMVLSVWASYSSIVTISYRSSSLLRRRIRAVGRGELTGRQGSGVVVISVTTVCWIRVRYRFFNIRDSRRPLRLRVMHTHFRCRALRPSCHVCHLVNLGLDFLLDIDAVRGGHVRERIVVMIFKVSVLLGFITLHGHCIMAHSSYRWRRAIDNGLRREHVGSVVDLLGVSTPSATSAAA
jgi:hypothetical protein